MRFKVTDGFGGRQKSGRTPGTPSLIEPSALGGIRFRPRVAFVPIISPQQSTPSPFRGATEGRKNGFPRPFPNLTADPTMRPNSVKRTLKAGKPSIGTWLSLGSVAATRFMARTGFAWLTVDIEHNPIDWETAATMFGAAADAGCVALARVPANRHDHIKRVLDTGAQGVVVPMVNTRQEAEDGRRRHDVSADRDAQRRRQPARAQLPDHRAATTTPTPTTSCWSSSSASTSRRSRTPTRFSRFPESTPFSSARTTWRRACAVKDGKPPSGEATTQAMKHILETCRKHRVAAGVHVTSIEEAKHRIEEGWQFLAVGSELKMMLDGAAAIVRGLDLEKGKGDLAKY